MALDLSSHHGQWKTVKMGKFTRVFGQFYSNLLVFQAIALGYNANYELNEVGDGVVFTFYKQFDA